METKAHVRATALAVLAVVLLAAWISAFHVQLLLIHGDSMAPAYRSGSLVLLEKRGAALDHLSENGFVGVMLPYTPLHYLVFGDDIDMLVMTSANLSDTRAAELPPEEERAAFLAEAPFVVPEGSLFLLGDNHGASVDSRDARVGLVGLDAVRGRVCFPRR